MSQLLHPNPLLTSYLVHELVKKIHLRGSSTLRRVRALRQLQQTCTGVMHASVPCRQALDHGHAHLIVLLVCIASQAS